MITLNTPAQTGSAFLGSYKSKIDATSKNVKGDFYITLSDTTIAIAPGASANNVTWKIGLPNSMSDAFLATTDGTTMTIPKQTVKDISGKSAVY